MSTPAPATERVLALSSPDGAPWAEDPTHFRIDAESRRCLNAVPANEFTSRQTPTVIPPWPILEVISSREDSYRYSEYFAESDNGGGEEFDNSSSESLSSDGSWDFVDVESSPRSVSTAPSSRATDVPNEAPKRQRPPLPETVKLEETISPELLPDILIVNDPQGKTRYLAEFDTSRETTRYKRVFPRLDDSAGRPATQVEASLNFTDAPLIGAGSHSRVYRTRFRLPVPLTARSSSGDVTVSAKMPLSDANSHRMLRHEAKMYSSAIPSYLTEDWTGYHFISEAMYDGDGVLPVAAVVPKFYGFYVPEHWSYRGLLCPIMLIEECGTPIDREKLRPKDREILYSLVVRLQRAGVCHGSFKSVNVLQQPGPISAPPLERSLDTPSFRVIDFGRVETREELSEKEWRALCREEMDDVKEEIYGRRKALRDPVSGRKYTTRRFLRSSAGLV